MTPTDDDILDAMKNAPMPQSIYIRAHLRRNGLRISPPELLARLNKIAKSGLITRSDFTNGYYGYTWSLAGNKAGDA